MGLSTPFFLFFEKEKNKLLCKHVDTKSQSDFSNANQIIPMPNFFVFCFNFQHESLWCCAVFLNLKQKQKGLKKELPIFLGFLLVR
jgi:hypothetical protein